MIKPSDEIKEKLESQIRSLQVKHELGNAFTRHMIKVAFTFDNRTVYNSDKNYKEIKEK